MFSVIGNLFGGAVGGLAAGLTAAGQGANQLVIAQQQLIKGTKQLNQSFLQLASRDSAGIGSATGGAFSILMSSFGSILTPALVPLAAAFLTLSDLISQRVVPALKELLQLGPKEVVKKAADAETGLIAKFLGFFGDKAGQIAVDARQKIADRAAAKEANKPSAEDLFLKNLDTVVRQMMVAMGQKGQVGFSGIADVWKQVQLKALMSPYEKRMWDLSKEQRDIAKDVRDFLKMLFGRGIGVQPIGGKLGDALRINPAIG